MSSKPLSILAKRQLVRVISADGGLAQRLGKVLDTARRFHIETTSGPLSRMAGADEFGAHASVIVVQLEGDDDGNLSKLEHFMHSARPPAPVIVVSGALSTEAARRLVRLRVSDWLPHDCSDEDLATACEKAVSPDGGRNRADRARCFAFFSAVGGSGATTLAINALAAVADKGKPARACLVDLDFQSGRLADYLDVEPNLDLTEISTTPERLDAQLLDVMLSRHASGVSVIAAPASLSAFTTVSSEAIGRLLDLASAKFDNLVLDMPPVWMPWCKPVVGGVDRFFIVTDLSVAGLRMARRLANLIANECEIDAARSVIVNKSSWRGTAGVRKRHARDILGEYLAGFVPNAGKRLLEEQNRGMVIATNSAGKSVRDALKPILEAR